MNKLRINTHQNAVEILISNGMFSEAVVQLFNRVVGPFELHHIRPECKPLNELPQIGTQRFPESPNEQNQESESHAVAFALMRSI